MSIRLSVVVPTWRRAGWLSRCLEATLGQDPLPAEIVVVGRSEDRDALDVVGRMRERSSIPIRWVEVSRPGHVAPVEAGVAAATGDVVAFVDDDAEPQQGWAAALLQPFAEPRVACVGGRVLTPGWAGRIPRDAGRIRWYGQAVGNVAALDGDGTVEVHSVMECNWAWRREALTRMEFDSALDFDDASMYGLDLCLQAREAGYRVVYQPGARVVHHVAPRDPALDRADRPRRTFSYARNYTYIALKHFRGVRRAAFMAWWWGVGSRGAYGLVGSVWDLTTRRGTGVRDLTAAAFAGRSEGLRQWRAR